MSYPAISLATATVGRYRCPQKRLQTARQPPVYPNSSPRIIAPVTPSPPSAALTPSIPVHRWIRANTDPNGNNARLLIELDGSSLSASPGERVGIRLTGTDAAVRGLIINNFVDAGVLVEGGPDRLVEGNWIGIAGDGATPIGNGEGVVLLNAFDNTVGGSDPAARNVISGPVVDGGAHIRMYNDQIGEPRSNVVQGNFIGTDATGTAVVDNGVDSRGVLIVGGVGNGILDTLLPDPSAPNVIGGHAIGIEIVGPGSSGNIISGSRIGTDLTGALDLGNGVGVRVEATDTIIGTGITATGNDIAFNTSEGVLILDGTGNQIRGNRIYANGGLGIDLKGDGVTLNDAGDLDASPNRLQNFPLLESINARTGKLTGSLGSTSSTEFVIEVFSNEACDPSGYGEGRQFVGKIEGVVTDQNGQAQFEAVNLDRARLRQFLTATATDPNGNTSEFSTCLSVPDQDILVNTTTADAIDVNPGDGLCDAGGPPVQGKPECTLRAAIIEANSLSGPDTIVVPEGVYLLSLDGSGEDGAFTGDLDTTGELTILGAGLDRTIINGNKGVVDDNVFHVLTGASLTITGAAITNGDRDGLHNGGGTLVLDSVVVSGHDEDGIENQRSGATATLIVRNSTIRNNRAIGVRVASGSGFSGATITNSTIRDNTTYGIYLSNSNSTSQANVINTTISSNGSNAVRAFPSNGGSSRAFFSHTTIANNSRGIRTGTASDTGSSSYTFKNSILANNGSDNCIGGTSSSNLITSLGHNISSDDGCPMFVETGDATSTDPLIGPLQDNGGPTLTYGLLIGSPGLDTADCTDTGANPVELDQRGRPRPSGAGCDVGAFEFNDAGIEVNPIRIYQGVECDSTLRLILTVSSTGQLPLDWSVTEDPPVGWLTASTTSSSVPTDAATAGQVTLDSTGLAAGRYQTTLQFDSVTPQGPVRVPLLLCVPDPCGPAESAWPMFRRNARNTGLSPYVGPDSVVKKWTFVTGGAIGLSSASIGPDGTIYIGAGDQKLYAVNPDGSLKWTFSMGGPIVSSPAVAGDGTVYLAARDRGLYAIRPDGTQKWRVPLSGSHDGPPTIGPDGTIYHAQCGSGSDLRAYDVDGNLLWSLDPPVSCKEVAPALGPDGTIYFAAGNGEVAAAYSDGSALKWTYTTGGVIYYSSPLVGSDGTIYVGSRDHKLHAVNPDGTGKWTFTTAGEIDSSPAIGPDGTVYVGSLANTFYAINPDGTLKWDFITTSGFRSGPAVDATGAVYVGSNDGRLYAFNPDGSVKWSFAAGDQVQSGPAIGADGSIYFGSLDSKLYALGPAPDLDVAPSSIEVTLPPNSTYVRAVTLSNPGPDIDWAIEEDPEVDWLSATPSSGTVAGGVSQEVQATFQTIGLTPGVYTTGLKVTSTDPDEPQIEVAVTLHVIPSATVWGLAVLAALFAATAAFARRTQNAHN